MENGVARHEWTDIAAAILLGVATIASAFCGYQATLWSGEQTANLAVATNRQFESMRKAAAADRSVLIDVATFFNLQHAILQHDQQMIAFIRSHARPEFRGPIEEWMRAEQASPSTAPTPFTRKDYQVADAVTADRLRKEGLAANDAATHANAQSDTWVMHTVVVTLALFFLSISTQARLRRVRRMTLTFGAIVLAAMVVSMARLPRAPGNHTNPATLMREEDP